MAETSLVASTTPNAYRRRTSYSFCPTNASWAVDNRTVGLRVLEGEDDAVRIEKRDGAADANPYLLMAAEIEAGLEGIAEGLAPGRPSDGDAYAEDWHPALPANLPDALSLARGSDFLSRVLGDVLKDLMIAQAENEVARVEAQVTPVETARYLRVM